jgi:hypothetical protein
MAETKNPYNVISYDFSLYAGMKYVIVNGYTNVDELKANAKKCNISDFRKTILDWDTIQKNRKIQKDFAKLISKHELENRKKSIGSTTNKRDDSQHQIKKVGTVKNMKKVGSIKTGKKVSKVKSSKKRV